MARGWESKSIEDQIERAEERKEQAHAQKLNDEEVGRQRQRESLELSRTRVLQDLENAKHPRHREMLNESLRFLDEKILAVVEPESQTP